MAVGKIFSDGAGANRWAHIYVEKEIHSRVNDLLNRIVYGRNRGGVCLQGGRKSHCTDGVRTHDDPNDKATSKWKSYDKIAVDLLKEYIRAFHREKKNGRLVVCKGEPSNGEKKAEGKEKKVSNTNECANGRSVNKHGDLPMVQLIKHTDRLILKKKQPSKNLPDDSNSRMNTTVHLNHLQYIWLKHTMIIFKLLIESNLRVEEKRKSEMTTTVLALLKRTLRGMPRGCPEDGSTRVDTLLHWAYLLSKVNMVDKELIIQMCHFFQNGVKTLSSLNKFYLLSCMTNFHSLSKKFLRVGNYLQGYFYNLLRMELGGHAKEGSKPTYASTPSFYRTDESTTTVTAHSTFCTSELCQVLFKQKKHLTHLDRTILKNVLNGEVTNYGKVTPPFFKFIVKLGDRELQQFLFDRIIEHVELYEQTELNNVLGSFLKREGLRKKSQGKLAKGEIHQATDQDEEFSTLVHILLEADLHNMNLKHVSYLYVYINRLLKKELRRITWWRSGKAMQEGECVGQASYTQSGSTKREDEVDTNPPQPFEQICEGQDFHEVDLHDGNPHRGNISLMNQVNEKIILTLEKKMYYIKMNNLVTLMYNTCPIISPKQISFLEVCFAHLVEEKYVTFNLAKMYRSLYNRFVHSGMCKSPKWEIGINGEKCLNQSSISNGENANWIHAAAPQYGEKMEKIFSYLKERYYLKREQDLGDISTCTILLNLCQKFLQDMLVYSFHRLQWWGYLRCSGAAAVLDLVQHIYTHLHFVIVSTRWGVEEKGVKDDCYEDGYDDEEEHRPLRRNQFELALLYGRNIVSHMGAYVDSVESASRFWGSSEDCVTVGHFNSSSHVLNEMNNSGGKNMPRGTTPNGVAQYSDQDLPNDPIDVQNVRHLMHYVNYVCFCIRERMEKVEGEKTWGKSKPERPHRFITNAFTK
ncbi:Uncharacterized protein PCOAH_00007720 [Plasmodium coatneyi]|uniref:Uncharacterized protein n=1 Tax=Plasmodium coatneyi TaxID=208452 RepID=A0A1B1DV14_9APIC|nr:Uncharacterized protein PCOAH_00007720 [Plasmodium coatneyi]ANQ06602.1 Uncharacterized protein PCOAH_00007720 [Plasmodium coatneyi]